MSGMILTCSTALADSPASEQVEELDGFPVFDQADNDDFVAWTDEVFGSGILDASPERPSHQDVDIALPPPANHYSALPSYFGEPSEQSGVKEETDGVVVSSEVDPARQMAATVVKAPTQIKKVDPVEMDVDHIHESTRIAQRPDRDAPGAGRPGRVSNAANLMDGDDFYRTPEVVEGRLELPPIAAASTSIENIGNGRAPEGFRSDTGSPILPLPEQGIERDPSWGWTVKAWNAPNTFSHPLYFEDRMLERHGHEKHPCLTPMVAGMRFFTTVPMLPYLATIDHPCECDYSMGYYRTGSCTPAYLQRPPYERRAVIAEAAAVTGAVLAFP
ncbi:hypothetical protein RMSM_02057 [Rhodopirellula maiorica SM1]|uniref:Uncharacterized protein n=1 Tax=Rhodopirellula maiorica SM1 TaxID=1265738 RepID=M5S029_9BACT|nr:hypothetical protein [Rhodopirellula maiorica]EMI21012.1 hypothetical protein RMSM_02057 [Rhodopirellula maiorica SM1]